MEGLRRVLTWSKVPKGVILTKDEPVKGDDPLVVAPSGPSWAKFSLGYREDFEQKYELLKKIGKGAQGKVRRCRAKETGKMYAVKIIKKKLFAKESMCMQLFKKEVKILETLKGTPHMSHLVEILEDKKKLYLVQDLCSGGELFKKISKHTARKGYSEAAAADILRQIFMFVAEIHLRGVVHRDIKPQNFIFRDKTSSDICAVDFGFGEFFETGKNLKEKMGSALYVAPEVLVGGGYGPKVDVWSVGVIMYLMLCGKPPFKGKNEGETLFEVMGAELDISWGPWYEVSDSAKDLVTKLLDRNPETRLTASQALSHEWLKEGGAPSTKIDFSVIHRMENYAHCSAAKRLLMSKIAHRLDPDSLADLRDQFILMDMNNDGVICMSELEEAVGKLKTGPDGARVFPEETVKQMFERIDMNESGEVDYWEFITAVVNWQQLSTRGSEDLHKCALDVFKSIDMDGNGFVDPKEIQLYAGCGEDVEDIVAEVSKNRDGHVNFRQFCKVLHHKRRSCQIEGPQTL